MSFLNLRKKSYFVLSQSLVFESVEQYKDKLEVIKESFLGQKIKPIAEEKLNEEFLGEEPKSSHNLEPQMQAYIQAVKKTIKK